MQASWLTVDNLNIHCCTAGESGSPVILLHGTGLDSASLSWGLTIPPLAQAHRVFAPDLPGYGQSDKPDIPYTIDFYISFLARLLDDLNLPKVSLVGFSMGGAIAIGFTLQYPQRVDKLVLVNPYGIMPTVLAHPLAYLYAHTPSTKVAYWFLKHSRKIVRLSLLAGLVSSPKRLSEQLVDEMFQAAQDPKAGMAFAAFLKGEIGWNGLHTNYTERLHEIAAPTLFIHGEKDLTIPLSYGKQAHKRMNNAQLHIISEAMHWPQRDKTDEFNRVLTDFLRD